MIYVFNILGKVEQGFFLLMTKLIQLQEILFVSGHLLY